MYCILYTYVYTKKAPVTDEGSKHELKSWIRQFVFHFVQILLGHTWINIFSLQLVVNIKSLDTLALVLQPPERKKTEFTSAVLHLKIDLLSQPTRGGGVEPIHTYVHMYLPIYILT